MNNNNQNCLCKDENAPKKEGVCLTCFKKGKRKVIVDFEKLYKYESDWNKKKCRKFRTNNNEAYLRSLRKYRESSRYVLAYLEKHPNSKKYKDWKVKNE